MKPKNKQNPVSRILIAEDNTLLAEILGNILKKEGLLADIETRAYSVVRRLESAQYDLLILDWNFPGEDIDGLDILSDIRAHLSLGSLPIIMVTGRARISDQQAIFSEGADDYVKKPFMPAELLIRIKARLRRPGHSPALSDEPNIPGWRLDHSTRKIVSSEGSISLPPRELEVLQLLLDHTGELVPRSELMATLWDRWKDSSNCVDVCMMSLRKKIAGLPIRIETIRGSGWQLTISAG